MLLGPSIRMKKKNENTPPPVMLTIQQSNLTIDIATLDESLSPLW